MFRPLSALRRSPLNVCIVFAAVSALSSACKATSPSNPGTSFEFTDTIAELTDVNLAVNHHDFQAAKAGTATITLTWPDPKVWLDLGLTGQSCSTDEFIESSNFGSHSGNDCSPPGNYESSGGLGSLEYLLSVKKDQKIRIWILNYGPGPQTYRITVNIE